MVRLMSLHYLACTVVVIYIEYSVKGQVKNVFGHLDLIVVRLNLHNNACNDKSELLK